MSRIEISFKDLCLNVNHFWNNGVILTAGSYNENKFNPMTIAWGSIGTLWKKPAVTVAIRPTRFTYEFMENYDTFTICAFPAQFKKTIAFLGVKSGRDTDKVIASGLTPISSSKIACPGYQEAELILECQKMYYDDIHLTNANENVKDFYHEREVHRIYYGEILAIHGETYYQKKIN